MRPSLACEESDSFCSSNPAATVRFSVIVPLYNKGQFILATLQDVIAQTYQAFEIVVVDDGSTDGGFELVERLANSSLRIVHQANAGPGPARNQGAKVAQGDWLALLDADDRWHPSHLASLAEVITTFSDIDVAATGWNEQTADAIDLGPLHSEGSPPKRFNYFRDAEYGQVHTSSLAIRRSTFISSGGFKNFIPGEDQEFWARLALNHRFAISSQVTSIYVRATGGITDQEGEQMSISGSNSPGAFAKLIEGALADPRYQARHADIEAFSDRAVMKGAKNLLYRGQGQAVRRALRQLRTARAFPRLFYLAASFLPSVLLRQAAFVFSKIKRVTNRAWARLSDHRVIR